MPNNKDKRNAFPVERQNETTEEPVCTFKSLIRSEQRCHRRVGYKNSVSRFHMLALSKCYELYESLNDGSYKTGVGKTFPVYEPKYRMVTSTSFRDRIPQTSYVLDSLYPKIVPRMIDENFACYAGRGVDAARNKFKEFLRLSNYTDSVLCADIQNYFASIEHEALLLEFSPFLSDSDLLFHRDVIESNNDGVGLSLGSEINQLSASSLPYRFDQEASKLGFYVRYMDDIRFIGSKEACLYVRSRLEQYLQELHLTLSCKKTYIQDVTKPISFLGFTFLKHNTNKITMKRLPDKLSHEKRKLRRMVRRGVPYERISVHYQSVRAMMKKGNRSGVVKLDKFVNSLTDGEIQNEHYKTRQTDAIVFGEGVFPIVTCGRKNRYKSSGGVLHS